MADSSTKVRGTRWKPRPRIEGSHGATRGAFLMPMWGTVYGYVREELLW